MDFVPTEISNRVDKLGYMPPQQQWLGGLVWQDVMMDQLLNLTKEDQADHQARQN